jgi:hypothetical protein
MMITINVMQSSVQPAVICLTACQYKIKRIFATPLVANMTSAIGLMMDMTLPNLHQNQHGQLTVGKRMAGMMMVTTFVLR